MRVHNKLSVLVMCRERGERGELLNDSSLLFLGDSLICRNLSQTVPYNSEDQRAPLLMAVDPIVPYKYLDAFPKILSHLLC